MRKICVITGSRAEYGLMYWLLKEIENDPELTLQLVATGMHLSPEFGLTYRQMEEDGFVIHAKVEMLLSSDTPVGISKSMGLGLIGFADVFALLKPDLILVLGDRYEIMVAVQAAMIANIPVCHLHGGESTEGLIDEAIRHSITKMSHLHFTATEKYRERVIRLGEQPDRVFNVGAVGLDNIKKLQLLDRESFEKSIDFRLGPLNFLVTYHPLTLAQRDSSDLVADLLHALDQFPKAHIIFTKPNSDMDGRIIGEMIDQYAARHKDRCVSFVSMGQLRYLSAIQHVDAVIGNSSSGVIEVPMFKKPTVDIGDRQKGRMKSRSVLECGDSADEISCAIRKALSPSFQEGLQDMTSLYGNGDTAPRIKEIVKSYPLDRILMKRFYEG
ncbi:UDP-N-acetylglucosamine 2-epimerase (hydrolyzing) [Cohnella pontilimi]|uniref:UDP-N-acetylglucosamine 2-epimerase (Hydrolyzing) n=1 Tax=Cohnella pontilimi TaxID=2564100 RepID=A0A4U0FB77_9BACL|nr:UDP-N-acetylglucosamine 2-epimerase [Cohnella pontilimi]TJY41960.1 UDP-N-acetylglucosamine 2-epimerase (hydrolyzing) [Cohnella pontilimi]